MKPSHVFLGERGVSLCFPNILPHIYALISLTITKLTGIRNHTSPLKIFEIISEEETPKRSR